MIHSPSANLEASPETLAQRIRTALTRISLALKNHPRKAPGALRLSPTQVQILVFLHSRPNHGETLTSIAEEMAVTPGTASTAVRTLERRGFVRKVRSKTDARFVTITLSSKGRRVAGEAASGPDFLTEAAKTFTEPEAEFFVRALMKFIRALQPRGVAGNSMEVRHGPRDPVECDPQPTTGGSPRLRQTPRS